MSRGPARHNMNQSPHIAVVIPCFRTRAQVPAVIAAIPPEVASIHLVDDACPEHTGRFVQQSCIDPRMHVHFNGENLGVGGAVMRGYREALAVGADVIVKIDGDGQMDPTLLQAFVQPILSGHADYTKGNRFFDLENIGRMPIVRIIGNAALSFLSKMSTGYWDIFDPTNGYTAIHADVARRLPFQKISRRYFFESDILFRLNTLRAVVFDVPMDARYEDEVSNLRVSRVLFDFAAKHARNFFKRIFYNFFLRDMSLASLELLAGSALMVGGLAYGLTNWFQSARTGDPTTAGTVMLAALPMLIGLQFILAFLSYDIASVPRRPIHRSGILERQR